MVDKNQDLGVDHDSEAIKTLNRLLGEMAINDKSGQVSYLEITAQNLDIIVESLSKISISNKSYLPLWWKIFIEFICGEEDKDT